MGGRDGKMEDFKLHKNIIRRDEFLTRMSGTKDKHGNQCNPLIIQILDYIGLLVYYGKILSNHILYEFTREYLQF